MIPKISNNLQNSVTKSRHGKLRMHWCIFCFRKCEDNTFFSESGQGSMPNDLMRFLKLLQRYTNSPKLISFLFNNVNDADQDGLSFRSCQDCLFFLQDFCDLYKEFELIEMKMNLKLDMLCAIITSAEKVSSRIEVIKDNFPEDDRRLKNLRRFRNELVTNVSVKLKAAKPKVNVKKCEVILKNTDEAVISPEGNQKYYVPEHLKTESADLDGQSDQNVDISEPFFHQQIQETIPSPVSGVSDSENKEEDTATTYMVDSNGISKLDDVKLETVFHDGIEENDMDISELSKVTKVLGQNVVAPELQRENIGDEDDKTSSVSEINDFQSDLDESNTPIDEESDNPKIVHSDQNDKNIQTPTLRRSKRASVITNARILKSAKLEESNSLSSETIPSLRYLAFKTYIDFKFVCSIFPCQSTTFWNANDLKNHQRYHGDFRCNFCDKTVTYAPDLLKHECEMHIFKSEKNYNYRNSTKCSRCDFMAPHVLLIVNHFLEKHLNLTPDCNTCAICHLNLGLGYASLKMRKHFRSHHDLGMEVGRSEVCDVEECKAFFRTAQQLSNHKSWVHGQGNEQKTETKHKQQGTLEKDVKPANSDNRLNLRMTNFNYLDNVPLSPSARELFGPPIECKRGRCKRIYYKQEEFNLHTKHHGKFKCNFCDEIVDYTSRLPIHELTHAQKSEEEPESKKLFNCSRCNFNTSTKNLLIFHFIENHLNLQVDYCTCPICNKELYASNNTRFPFRQNLRSHILDVHDFTKKIYECKMEGCKAYFNTKKHLLVHQNNHKYNVKFASDRTRIFECKICEKPWSTRKKLQAHYRDICSVKNVNMVTPMDVDVEDGMNESFICHQCGKSLNSQDALNGHVALAHGWNKPKTGQKYICETCGKEFKYKHNLESHLLSHTGPESWKFSCTECGKRSMTQANLREHLKTHSKEKYFTCEHCGVSFSNRHNLMRHINSVHRDIVNSNESARKLDKSKLTSKKRMDLKKSGERCRM